MKKVIRIFFILMVLGFLVLWFTVGRLSAPVYLKSEVPSADSEIEIIFKKNVTGWYVQSKEHSACILLLHGVRASRKEMIGRSDFLQHAGYSSLAIDLQAHGENSGEKITFGFLESESARFAVRFLYAEKIVQRSSLLVTP